MPLRAERPEWPPRGVSLPAGRRGESGAGTVGSLIGLVLGGGLVMLVLALFLTGLAQKEIIPRLEAKVDATLAASRQKLSPKPKPEAASADSSLARKSSPADSLEALLTQMETQRKALDDEKADLARMRGTVDSLLTEYRGVQSKQTSRQAKLLAGMNPDEAARVCDAMDDASVSTLLNQMNVRLASQVLAKLDSRRAARLTLASMGESRLDKMGSPVEAGSGAAAGTAR